jgi:hypothetical protein
MSISDKQKIISANNVIIAENEQKVFDAGREMGLSDGHFTGYQDGLAAGKQAQYDAFWDAFQNYGNKRYYYYAFACQQTDNEAWATDAYNPKYPIIADCNAGEPSPYATQSIFHYSSRLKDVKVPITLKNGAANNCFYRCYVLKTIPSLTLENITGFNNTFAGCGELETLIVHGTIGADIDIHWSTKLTRESIDSIVNALSTETSGLTCTLSLDAVNKAFETSEGANDGSTSADWIALDESKDNWAISLI